MFELTPTSKESDKRHFSGRSIENFKSALSRVNWLHLCRLPTINEAYDHFHKIILHYLYFPLVKILKRYDKKSYINRDVRFQVQN